MTAEHLLQTCSLYKVLRKRFWSQPTSWQNKLFGCLDDLRRTAIFARETQATILMIDNNNNKALSWDKCYGGRPPKEHHVV
ncbi:hypothetical protein RRG08_010455 [Elysia crispata]|uniref:Uncharacterized protein n=1 Tax=Elysia crispata TaxID=231223 RepID=A0AAE1APN5_9GAST|nr:hypothetical protein RRG08_010455 [Elysia crispata]